MKSTIKALCAFIIALLLFSVAQEEKRDIPREAAKHVVPFRISIMNNGRYATGFHLNYRGKIYIVTNRHVCDAHERIFNHNDIQFDDYVGKIIAIDNVHDLCLVTSNREEGLSLAKEQSIPLDKVYVVGFPRGLDKTIREGRIVGPYPMFAPWLDDKEVESIQVSAIAYGGNSGSPILNTKGEVTGVLFAGHKYFHTETYIVPLSYLKSFLEINAR